MEHPESGGMSGKRVNVWKAGGGETHVNRGTSGRNGLEMVDSFWHIITDAQFYKVMAIRVYF